MAPLLEGGAYFNAHSKENIYCILNGISLVGSDGKDSAPKAGHQGSIPELEYPLEKRMATHSSILARRIPWTEEPGGLQSTGLQGVRHD